MAFRFQYPLLIKENHKRQVYRALYHYLKNRFMSVEFGISSIEDEFFQELVLILPDGSSKTIKEITKAQFDTLQYKSRIESPFKEK